MIKIKMHNFFSGQFLFDLTSIKYFGMSKQKNNTYNVLKFLRSELVALASSGYSIYTFNSGLNLNEWLFPLL